MNPVKISDGSKFVDDRGNEYLEINAALKSSKWQKVEYYSITLLNLQQEEKLVKEFSSESLLKLQMIRWSELTQFEDFF